MAKQYFQKDKIEADSKKVQKTKYYKDNSFSVQKETSPEYKDTKEYMLPWAQQIYSLFVKKKTWMGGGYDDIDMMRSYMEGNQTVDQYRDFIYGKPEQEIQQTINSEGFDIGGVNSNEKSERTAWVNIDEKPISIGPKITTKALEQARGMYYEIGVNAIDSMSVITEEMEKARMWFKKENADWIRTQKAMLGLKEEEPEFMPININELELYKSSGGFKVPYALGMEELLKHTFHVSDFDKEVREKWIKDLISCRFALTREYYDPEEKRVKIKYVDIKYGGLQFSRDFSFKDSEYGFELEEWPISKVMQKFNMSREDAAALAYAYSNEWGNPSATEWMRYGYWEETTGSLGFDFYKVPIFRCEFVDVDNEKYYKHVTKNGRVFNKPVGNKKVEEAYDNKIRYVRECTWIVGTQHLCDYGKVQYMVRNNPKKPRISYRGVRLGVPALFQQIRPLLNGLTLAYWKAQQAIAIAVSNGFAVDVGALKNIAIGKDKSWDVTKVLAYYRQQSILLHKRNNPMNFAGGGGMSPVTPLVTRMHENIIAQFDIMNRFMAMIESISGINLVSTGETPDPRIGKFNMQIAMQGTNQIIGSIIRSATELQEDVSVNITYRIRSLARANKAIADSYANVIGKQKMQTILMAEKSNVEYGINIQARDVSEMKMFIEGILTASMQASAQGAAGMLDPSEVILVRDMLEQNQNMRMISLTLGYMLRKKGKEKELQQMQMIELQGNQTMKAEQAKQASVEGERMFELAKMSKEFEYDYMLKYGRRPDQSLTGQPQQQAQGMQQMQGASQMQGMPQAQGMPQEQPQQELV